MPLESREDILRRHYQRFIEGLAAEVGKPPVASIAVVHWGDSMSFDTRVIPSAAPQAQMNLLDDMLRRLREVGEQYKARLNIRRGKISEG